MAAAFKRLLRERMRAPDKRNTRLRLKGANPFELTRAACASCKTVKAAYFSPAASSPSGPFVQPAGLPAELALGVANRPSRRAQQMRPLVSVVQRV